MGYGGTKTEMERLLADAEKLSGVHYDMDNLGDVYSAIHVIQENLGLTGVAAEEASETFTGSLGSMKAAAENLMANIALGEDIQPALMTLLTTVRNFVLNNLFPMLANIFSSLPDIFNGAMQIGNALIMGITEQVRDSDGVFNIISGLAENILMWIPYLAGSAIELAKAIFDGIVSFDWIGAITEFADNVLFNLDLAAGEEFGYESAAEMMTAMVDGIMTSIPQLITMFGTAIETLLNFIVSNLPLIVDQGKDMLLSLVRGIVSHLPDIASSMVSVVSTLLTTLVEHLPEILEMGVTVIMELITGLLECLPVVIESAFTLASGIVDTFKEIDWVSLGKNLIDGIINGIKNMGGALIEAAKNAAKAAFDAAKDFLGIHSPATKGIYIGEMYDRGIAGGVEDNADLIDNAVKSISKNMNSDLMVSAQGASFDVSATADSKVDVLIALLTAYLPEIAKNKGVSINDLYNGINRQLGIALA